MQIQNILCIKRPDAVAEGRVSDKFKDRSLKFIQRQYDNLERKIIKLVRAVNTQNVMFDTSETQPNLNSICENKPEQSHQLIKPARITQFADVIEEKFMAFDPLIARILVKVGRFFRSLYRFIICKPQIPHPETKVPQATSNSSSGMLTLSIHLNHLITWISTIFSVALAYTYIHSDNQTGFIIGLTIANGIISCASGFFISTQYIQSHAQIYPTIQKFIVYLIKRLEESLSDQILTIFFTSTDRQSTQEQSNEPKHQPRQHIQEKQSAMTKVLVKLCSSNAIWIEDFQNFNFFNYCKWKKYSHFTLIVIGLAFAICISIILNLEYQERLTALITFLLASMLDIVILRPIVILIDSILTFLGIRITGFFRKSKKVAPREII